MPLNKCRNIRDTYAGTDIGKDERSIAAHLPRIPIHDLQTG
ncbi:MAG: hypothetical protein QOG73_1985, partial [Acetobacteraceae bacterium]|nr:hypothetical protein [Acetobacteraceae bacterium]